MNGAPLVLVPGWGMAPVHWGDFGGALAVALGAVTGEAFDLAHAALPGHGGAPDVPGWDVEALADQWVRRWPGAVWVGWSLGGLVALAAALRAPEAVRALVLIGATPCFVERNGWPEGMDRDRFEDFRARCRTNPAATRSRFLAMTMRGDRFGKDGLRALRTLDRSAPAPAPAALCTGLRVLAQTDLAAGLASIRCPTLWLAGTGDDIVSPAAAERAARSQPRARVSCLPGAGHAPFLTHGQDVIGHTRNWFQDTCG